MYKSVIQDYARHIIEQADEFAWIMAQEQGDGSTEQTEQDLVEELIREHYLD